MGRKGRSTDEAVLECLRGLIHGRGIQPDDLAVEIGADPADLKRWLDGDLSGIDLQSIAALHKVAMSPIHPGGRLELAALPPSFPPGTNVTAALLLLDERLQRLEQNTALQTDLMRQVVRLSQERHGRYLAPVSEDEDIQETELAGAQHGEWSTHLSTFARDELIDEAISILDELSAKEEGENDGRQSTVRDVGY